MTKKEIELLNNIYSDLNKAEHYLLSDDVQVSRKFGNDFIPINKMIGSDLCYVYNAKSKIKNFLEMQYNKKNRIDNKKRVITIT